MKQHKFVVALRIEDIGGGAADLEDLSSTATWLEVRLQSKALVVDATAYPSVEALNADRDATDPPVHVLIQEGGSSTELYLHAYDTADEAQAARVSCADAGSYRTSDVVEVPPSLANHPKFFEVVEALLKASTNLSYGEA